MKFTLASILAYLSVVSAHSIFQKISVNGKEYNDLVGIQAPDQNNPTEDVTSPDMTCGKVSLTGDTTIPISAGYQVGAWWGHVIGGPMSPGDADHPIPSSHHGPNTAWLAPVQNAESAEADSSIGFFKILEDGFDMETKTWGVDNMIANNDWTYFDASGCIAPGDYILCVELLTLHSAYDLIGAQLYISCVNITVSGDGNFEPDETQNFPGANGKEYLSPGMKPITC